MSNALIGFSGFVGSTLMKQTRFEQLYRSTSIGDIDGRGFNTLICAGAPAQKWIANRDPEADRQKIEGLIEHLRTVHCETFVLISTVDVFAMPMHVDEGTPVNEVGLHAYGLNRRLLECFVEDYFPRHLIVRLPGLVGPGLRKNVIFDLLNHNNLDAIDSRGRFQFYPMVNLWHDIRVALDAGLSLIHLCAEPLSVADVALHGFGKAFTHELPGVAPAYSMQTRHADLFGVTGHYQYSARETLLAVRSYAQSEPRSLETME
ncbi:pyridine nucleotide transhydrogenase [Pseudomonas sp. NPDC090202]|uniref:pyridine nucleotide transhydrogenase n=1 Tax=unclassified Pseudomonas TaxID=196821 RepID=UPI00380C8375